ncbi:MAG: HEAT repeat domain-containing protein [Planctomycetota bacterium]
MLAPILAAVCSLAAPSNLPAPLCTPARCTPVSDDKAVKALAAWLKLYRAGKINIYSTEIVRRAPIQVDWHHQRINAKESVAVRFGLQPKGGLGEMTWLSDLETIAEAVAKLDDAAAGEALVDLAAVGMDHAEYSHEMAPELVRGVGERCLASLKSDAAREAVATFVRGQAKTDRNRASAQQGAAVRALAAFHDVKDRQVVESLLSQTDPLLRFHAAEALGALGEESAAPALIGALEREESELVIPALADALRAIYAKYVPKPKGEPKPDAKDGAKDEPKGAEAPKAEPTKALPAPDSTRLAVRAALTAIGRSTWRADMAIMRLLGEFRDKSAVPVLIGVLERYRDNPDQVQSGKLSGLVLHRAHELLVTMTGAVYPATEPDKWRAMWDLEKDKIEITKPHAPPPNSQTAASGFCGIPVQGTRILFILDLSRSMTFAMTRKGTGGDKNAPSTRIDFARRELYAAIDQMSERGSFNLISFDGNPKAKIWSKNMLPATEKNREKLKKYLSDLEPDGGTNLWSALEEAMKIKSLVYGDRYETNVDEIFLLSDGAPSVGEVLDPREMLRLVKEGNRFANMRINTVFITSPNEEERTLPTPWMEGVTPEDFMRRLAEDNGGKCVIL